MDRPCYKFVALPHDGGMAILRHAVKHADEIASGGAIEHSFTTAFAREFAEFVRVFGLATMWRVLKQYQKEIGLPKKLVNFFDMVGYAGCGDWMSVDIDRAVEAAILSHPGITAYVDGIADAIYLDQGPWYSITPEVKATIPQWEVLAIMTPNIEAIEDHKNAQARQLRLVPR